MTEYKVPKIACACLLLQNQASHHEATNCLLAQFVLRTLASLCPRHMTRAAPSSTRDFVPAHSMPPVCLHIIVSNAALSPHCFGKQTHADIKSESLWNRRATISHINPETSASMPSSRNSFCAAPTRSGVAQGEIKYSCAVFRAPRADTASRNRGETPVAPNRRGGSLMCFL